MARGLTRPLKAPLLGSGAGLHPFQHVLPPRLQFQSANRTCHRTHAHKGRQSQEEEEEECGYTITTSGLFNAAAKKG